jgi:hypothetical protein
MKRCQKARHYKNQCYGYSQSIGIHRTAHQTSPMTTAPNMTAY